MFQVINLDSLESAATFLYLVCTIVYNNSDWEALEHNMGKAWSRWDMVLKVLEKKGVTVWAR